MRRQSRLIGTWPHGQLSGEHTWSRCHARRILF